MKQVSIASKSDRTGVQRDGSHGHICGIGPQEPSPWFWFTHGSGVNQILLFLFHLIQHQPEHLLLRDLTQSQIYIQVFHVPFPFRLL
jgi:hypothetical protein